MVTRAHWKFAMGFAVAMLVACHPRAMPAVPSEPGSTTPTPLPKPAREMPATAVPGDLLTWGINFANPPIVPYQGTLNWTPVQVPSLKNVIAISGGGTHSLALQADGTVWAWGDNEYGQLGDGNSTDWVCKEGEQPCYPGSPDHTSLPVQVAGLRDAAAVSAGSSQSLALKSDGTVWAWEGGTADRRIPAPVTGLTEAVAIAAGRGGQSLALRVDGTFRVWGNNDAGQLGLGDTTPYSTPVLLPDLHDVVAIASGNSHSLALTADGTVWAWGNNKVGQLGNDGVTNYSRPVQVIGLKDIVAIAGGGAHSLALKSDGTVWSWGDNEHGQLGDGTTANHLTPMQVAGLTGVIAIATGDSHSLALKSDGTVCPGPHLSQPAPEHPVFPYLLRGLTVTHPNQVWGIDITYIRLAHGWLYLVAVLDWFSRYVLSWELDQTLELPFVLAAVERALAQATPEIWNSDQGSHFTSPQYLDRLQAAEVQISMDGKGRALDNIFTERLWRTVKYEEVYLHDYTTPREARQGLARYFPFYNHQRPHQALQYCTPAQVFLERGKACYAST